ncbi:hypothetical protein [Aquihabitans sp. McL0605]|uniref:hypothetical protein n=1 Tax=Aquihabitans sp. McL0605 TaxID=3415671 RepID=UPI003CFB1DAB
MGFLVVMAVFIVAFVACCYYGQVLGQGRVIGSWGGLLLAFFLGPLGLLVILLFPKVALPAG